MAKVLLLVHGMGEHPTGWSQDIVAKLDEAAARYPAFKNQTPFSQRLRIEEIRYDDVFAQVVAGWNQDAKALDDFATKSGRPLPKVVSWLRKPLPTSAKGFFWSTAIDPLLYRGFPLVRDNVRAQVTAQIAEIVADATKNGAAEFSILAHSLGTAVMHDSLDVLGRAPYKGNEALTAKHFQFANLFMLADVCLLARNLVADIDYFDSVVRPTSAGTADNAYCQCFINVFHRFDPFVGLAPFRPTSWGQDYVELPPLEHWRQANIHGYTHYLDNPLVHAPIINGALGMPLITDFDLDNELQSYQTTPTGGCVAEIALLKQKGQELANATDLEEIIIRAAEFLAAAEQAGHTCAGLLDKDMFV